MGNRRIGAQRLTALQKRGATGLDTSAQAGAGIKNAIVSPYKEATRWGYPSEAPIQNTIPVQQLAYHAALAKGTDVDQPRNLAKSVTVE